MKSNINKVAERGERLDDLQDKTGEFMSVGLLTVYPPLVPSFVFGRRNTAATVSVMSLRHDDLMV